MNALRLQHLEGRRRQNGVCGNCGQLSHCLPDNIDAHRLALLDKFKQLVAVDPDIEPPGGAKSQVHGRGGGMKILHVTPHLGGGVGKAHAAISAALPDVVEQTFVLLEAAARPPLSSKRSRLPARRVVVAGDLDQVAALAREADIVQFEFWNHPRLFECLARCDFPRHAQRVLVAYFRPVPAAHPAGPDGTRRGASSSRPKRRCRSRGLPRRAQATPKKIAVINSGFGFAECAWSATRACESADYRLSRHRRFRQNASRFF